MKVLLGFLGLVYEYEYIPFISGWLTKMSGFHLDKNNVNLFNLPIIKLDK